MKIMINTMIVLLGLLGSVFGQTNASSCVNITTYLYNCTNVSTAPTPVPVVSSSVCVIASGCYPYTTFLSFYEDNLYAQYKTVGHATFAIIIVHICLAPILYAALLIYKSPNGRYEATARRISSTRKMLIWFSGIPVCFVDTVLFLWAPLTTIVYLVMFLHIAGILAGVFVWFQTVQMGAGEILTKSSDTLTPVQAHVVVNAYCLKNKINLKKASSPDSGKNHDKFVAHICVPTITDNGVNKPKKRFLGNGNTQSEALNNCYSLIDTYWLDLPGYAAVKVSLGSSAYDQVHVDEQYEEGLEEIELESVVSRSVPQYHSEQSLSRATQM